MYFSQDLFKMTAMALVSVINYYDINGLHLFIYVRLIMLVYIYIYIYIYEGH